MVWRSMSQSDALEWKLLVVLEILGSGVIFVCLVCLAWFENLPLC